MIRLASMAEAVEILSDKNITQRINYQGDAFTVQPWVVEKNHHKLLFVFWPQDVYDNYEMHIACPKASILKSRELTRVALNWLREKGVKSIATYCPEGKIANMARKLHFTELGKEGDTVFFRRKF